MLIIKYLPQHVLEIKKIKENVYLMRNTIFLTCNFAVSYASMNRKVSLIDLNQNKKKGVFIINEMPGLSQLDKEKNENLLFYMTLISA